MRLVPIFDQLAAKDRWTLARALTRFPESGTQAAQIAAALGKADLGFGVAHLTPSTAEPLPAWADQTK